MFKTLKPTDRIITGDSGPGYLNPTQLFVPRAFSGLPDGTRAWLKHAAPLYKQFDITFTGFLVNGDSGKMTVQAEQLYALHLSPDGMVEQTGYSPTGGVHLVEGTKTPVFQEWDLSDSVDQSVEAIKSFFKPGQVQFQVYRSILKTATYHKQIQQALQAFSSDIVVVEPLVLSLLAQIYLSN